MLLLTLAAKWNWNLSTSGQAHLSASDKTMTITVVLELTDLPTTITNSRLGNDVEDQQYEGIESNEEEEEEEEEEDGYGRYIMDYRHLDNIHSGYVRDIVENSYVSRSQDGEVLVLSLVAMLTV